MSHKLCGITIAHIIWSISFENFRRIKCKIALDHDSHNEFEVKS